jgi:hypothetical protein
MTSRFRTLALLAASVTALAGCTSIKYDDTGDTVAVYQFGEFKMLLNTTAPKAAAAAQKAIQQMDLYQTSTKIDRFEARFVARARNDQRVNVIIQEVNSVQTLVRIRWGEAGEMGPSRRLFDAIEANLK